MGHTGMLTLLDGKTGKPRTIINIEKAALSHSARKREVCPCFRKYRERGGSEGYSPEDEDVTRQASGE